MILLIEAHRASVSAKIASLATTKNFRQPIEHSYHSLCPDTPGSLRSGNREGIGTADECPIQATARHTLSLYHCTWIRA